MTPSERATTVAANLFARKGYDGTSTRELAEALGVTKGTFYHHFPSKEDLLMSDLLCARLGLADAIDVSGSAC